MMKKTYLLFLISLFIFSCKDEAQTDAANSDEYESLLLGISRSQIDSIKNSEAKKQVVLKKFSYELDSANSIDVMLPVSNFLKEYSFSSKIYLTDPESTSDDENLATSTAISILNPFSDGDLEELLLVGKSTDPNIFPVSDIKKFNEPEKIIYEDKNSLLYVDGYGRKLMYYRQYNPANSTYYLYTVEVPKFNDQKLQYATLFSVYNKAQNLLAFDKETPSENLTWEKVRSSISESELKNYNVYYASLQKEIKYFLKSNDSVNINRDKIQFYLYRDEDHSKNKFDQVTFLASSQYAGLFGDLDFENRMYSGYFNQHYDSDDDFKFIKGISDHSILVSATKNGYSSDETKYYIISSINMEKGQFYLISPTNEQGNDLTALMNDHFSKHLKI
ncbi:hypothetical protein SAMN04488097_1414 [Epilithonimonas lactis]|uniref:Uncharacterized protein n=2 Tax=Epilithonimonas lactis TaxID=421072 RepID=A0A085BLT4_9FLAO|nr:hypothetical protein IO89_02250 [Epilithonimonas lactis]SEQ12886.1 hypothetical protein SAMN04488097_1414 [Epilithonimonas lactis]